MDDKERKTFKIIDYSKKILDNQSFTDCTFQSCNFTESNLKNSIFTSCKFIECNFSLVKLDGSRLQNVQFSDSKIVGGEFFKCDKMFLSLSFKNCLLHYCNFSDLNMKNTPFLNSQLKECYFNNTNLTNVSFTEANLNGTLFHNCDLSKADFSSATQYDINPTTNKIKKAKFSFPEATGLLKAFDIIIT